MYACQTESQFMQSCLLPGTWSVEGGLGVIVKFKRCLISQTGWPFQWGANIRNKHTTSTFTFSSISNTIALYNVLHVYTVLYGVIIKYASVLTYCGFYLVWDCVHMQSVISIYVHVIYHATRFYTMSFMCKPTWRYMYYSIKFYQIFGTCTLSVTVYTGILIFYYSIIIVIYDFFLKPG